MLTIQSSRIERVHERKAESAKFVNFPTTSTTCDVPVNAAMWRTRIETAKKLLARSCSANSKHAQDVRPFEDIPGPKSLPVVGTLYKYLPLIGKNSVSRKIVQESSVSRKISIRDNNGTRCLEQTSSTGRSDITGEYSFTRLHTTGLLKLKRYGPLVREEIVPGVPTVWVFRPEDIASVLQAEAGLYPERRSHLALLKYRKDRSNVYNTGGLLPTNGADWWRLRREFQKVLSKPRNVAEYLEDTDVVVQEFVKLCQLEKIDDFLPLLSRLFLELTCLVAFDVRMNSFSEEERRPDSRSSKLIDAAFETNSVIVRLDNGPRLWRYFETRLYRKLRKAQSYMEEVSQQMVSQRNQSTSIRRKKSLLEEYSRNEALDIKDIVGMSCDMLLAGVDTTTYSTSFALYHLARNSDLQDKLRHEATALLADPDSPITLEVLSNAAYTKAVIKETFRMNPISVGIGRILQTDVVLNGYHVPRGTVVVTQNQVTCRLPEYFNEPNSFVPERWLRSKDRTTRESINPYLVLPFGHGPRSCIARRFAEQNIQVVLLRMCRNLRFTWCGGNLGTKSLLINKPDAPIKLEFECVNA
ncbi:cytochrome P450 302a1, mitochondrial isoform X2 [Harpegnathos saltator]|uniref:cytochrome P450 302a1, mitochondrial isoform X2 n=1 Tax=Harpegnathos saltator TaxID=610380 RepID=UPI000DBEE4DE|nr:cytochrome P450 302a1, mitochondrial isoform X2 [Harpegnathos saltator]